METLRALCPRKVAEDHWREEVHVSSGRMHLRNEIHRPNVPGFFRTANSLIARGVNRTWEREGHLFAARSRIHPCIDDKAAEQKLIYALTNPVKDNLVETVSRSPFFSTYRHQAFGDELRFWFLDYQAYWAAGGKRKKGHRLKDYLNWVTWECTPHPRDLRLGLGRRRYGRHLRRRAAVLLELDFNADLLIGI